MLVQYLWERPEVHLYDNEYASFINLYFYEFLQPSQTSIACAPKHLRHPV
jgi:hypothetical protein